MQNLALTAIEQRALTNSIIISLGVSFLTVSISLFLSLTLNFLKLPKKRLFYFLFLLPILIPPYLHAYSAMHFAIIASNLKLMGSLSCCTVELLNSTGGIIILLTIAYFPLAFFIINQTLTHIPQSILDAAVQIANPIKVLRRIIIPYLTPAVITSFLLIFILSFITFDVPAFMGKNVFVVQIFKTFTLSNNLTKALYLSLIPMILMGFIFLILLFYRGLSKPLFSIGQSKVSNLLYQDSSTVITFLILSIYLFLIFLSVALPLGLLIVKSITYNDTPFYTVASGSVITNSFWISIISSFALVFFAFITTFVFYKNLIARIIFLSFLIIPAISVGIGFIYLFNQPYLNFIYATPLILILAYCVRFTPLISEFLYLYKLQVNPQYIESAQLIPSSWWRKLTLVFLPLYKPAIFSGLMIGFWLVITELPITLLLEPPGFQTIITRLFIVLHYGAEEMMALLTLILLAVSFLPIAAIYLYFKIDKSNT